LIRMKKKG